MQLSGPRHSLVLVRAPSPQDAEHSDHSVQHDHWPSAVLLTPEFIRHGWELQIRLCVDGPSQGGDLHCLPYKKQNAFTFRSGTIANASSKNRDDRDVYPVLSAPSARTVASTPSGPFSPAVLVGGFPVYVRVAISSQTGAIVPAVTLLFLGELHSHARRVVRLRAAAKPKAFLHVAHAAALQTGVHCQPRSPSGVTFGLGTINVALFKLKYIDPRSS